MTDGTHKLKWVSNGGRFEYGSLRKFIQGRPKGTKVYTTEQLEEMGLVGYYKKIEKAA